MAGGVGGGGGVIVVVIGGGVKGMGEVCVGDVGGPFARPRGDWGV